MSFYGQREKRCHPKQRSPHHSGTSASRSPILQAGGWHPCRDDLQGTVLRPRPELGAGGARVQGREHSESLSICPGLGCGAPGLVLSFLTRGDCCSKLTSAQTALCSAAQLRLQEPGALQSAWAGDGAGLPHDMTRWCLAAASPGQWWRGEGLISKPLVSVSWDGAFLHLGRPGSAIICSRPGFGGSSPSCLGLQTYSA